jgi:hypothetical protein
MGWLKNLFMSSAEKERLRKEEEQKKKRELVMWEELRKKSQRITESKANLVYGNNK